MQKNRQNLAKSTATVAVWVVDACAEGQVEQLS